MKFEPSLKEAAKNPRFRQMFDAWSTPMEQLKGIYPEASKARPYLPDMAWALFSAYQAALIFAVVRLQMLKAGLDAPEAIDAGVVTKLITTALPHRADYVEKYGPGAFHHLLD